MNRKFWCAAAAALAAAGMLAALFYFRVRHDMEDFAVNEKAARRMSVGETLYRAGDEHWQFKYMPAAALLYMPLTSLDRTAALAVWFLVVAGSCAGLVLVSRRLLPPSRRTGFWITLIPPLILLRFFLREIELGQINALVTLLLLLAVHQLVRAEQDRPAAHDIAAGILWGTAIALKPYSAILLPWLIIKGRWRSLLAGLGVTAAAVLAPVLYYGWRGNLVVHGEWLSTLSRSTPRLFTSQDNISLAGFLSKWTGGAPIALLLAAGIGALALLFLAMIFRGRRMPRSAGLEGAVLLTMTPLVSPLGWDYTFLMATAGIMFLVAFFDDFPRPARWILGVNFGIIALSLYDILGRSAYAAFMRLSIPTLCFLLIAAALARLRFRAAA